MNVIIANRYQELLINLDIDIIKTMTGEFSAEELIESFSNFFFNKMILDITAIKDYQDLATIQRLTMGLDMNKVILLLDDSPEATTPSYLSKLISMGIYNFTKNVDNIKYLIDNPNQYKDVAHYHKLDDTSNPIIDTSPGESFVMSPTNGPIIIGVRNVTRHAGATTLTYMMKKQLRENYSVLAVELNKNDFIYFNDKELVSTTKEELPKILLKSSSYDIVLIDLNDAEEDDTCNEVIHLIEPTTIKLNKMIRRNRSIFGSLKGKKIVLNQSLLDQKDVMDFEYESRSEVFFNVPPLDDKINRHRVLDDFMSKLGLSRQSSGEEPQSGGNIFSIFKK